MEKAIEVIFLKQAEEFIDAMDARARMKLFKAIRKTAVRIAGPWFAKLTGSDGIFEFRIDESGKFYRLFAFWDSGDESATLVVATHGLVKKTNKTPKGEIRKAERMKRAYLEGKIEASGS